MSEKTAVTTTPKQSIVETVQGRIKDMEAKGDIHFPANYSFSNALRSAWLILQETKDRNGKPALEACTQASISNALLNTVVGGLSPMKKQVYFIVYGNQLTAMRSYFGTLAMLKRIKGVSDVIAQVIYEGDKFEFEIREGTKYITKHESSLSNIDGTKIIGAYCTIFYGEGEEFTEIMNWAQIQKSWSKSKTGGGVQKEFPEEMAKRTVINRTAKMFVNTSDDSDLVINAFHETDGGSYETPEAEIQREANQVEVDVKVEPSYKVQDEPEETPKKLMGDELPKDEF